MKNKTLCNVNVVSQCSVVYELGEYHYYFFGMCVHNKGARHVRLQL